MSKKILLWQVIKIMQDGGMCKNLSNGNIYKIINNELFQLMQMRGMDDMWLNSSVYIDTFLKHKWREV